MIWTYLLRILEATVLLAIFLMIAGVVVMTAWVIYCLRVCDREDIKRDAEDREVEMLETWATIPWEGSE